MREYIANLVKRGIIKHSAHADEILYANDINYILTGANFTLLSALLFKKLPLSELEEIVRTLISLGADPNIGMQTESTPANSLFAAVDNHLQSIIAVFLPLIKNPAQTFYLSRNILHHAVALGNIETVAVLLKDERIFQLQHSKDATGQTPLDTAARNKNDEMIMLLHGKNLSEEEQQQYHYGETFINISQDHLNDQLRIYQQVNHRDFSYLDAQGQCNGYAFLHQIFMGSNREEEFYGLLETISQWQADQAAVIPAVLQSKYQSIDEIFEEIINLLTVYHARLLPFHIDAISLKQKDRVNQFNLTKNIDDDRILINLYRFNNKELTHEQLSELLHVIQAFSGCVMDVTTYRHAMSLNVNDNKQFSFYDSNIPYRFHPISEVTTLSALMGHSTLKKQGVETVLLGFHLHQFVREGKDSIPTRTITMPLSSSCHFSALHYAVFENAVDSGIDIVQSNPGVVFDKDIYGKLALHYLFEVNNFSFLNQILSLCSLHQLTMLMEECSSKELEVYINTFMETQSLVPPKELTKAIPNGVQDDISIVGVIKYGVFSGYTQSTIVQANTADDSSKLKNK